MSSQINSFPDELLINIFSHLNPAELATTGLVSKKWHEVSCDDSLWKDLFKDFSEEFKDTQGFRNALFKMKKITNYEEIIADFEAFSGSVEENQAADYECFFLKNPDCFLNIEFGVVKNPEEATRKKRQVLFIKGLPHNGAMVYGKGLEQRIQAELPSPLSLKEINKSGDPEIIDLMRVLYTQVRKTDYALDIGKKTISQIQTIQTAISTGVIAAFIFGLTYYNFG